MLHTLLNPSVFFHGLGVFFPLFPCQLSLFLKSLLTLLAVIFIVQTLDAGSGLLFLFDSLQMNNLSCGLSEKVLVVRDEKDRSLAVADKVFQPSQSFKIKVIRGLVKKENVPITG